MALYGHLTLAGLTLLWPMAFIATSTKATDIHEEKLLLPLVDGMHFREHDTIRHFKKPRPQHFAVPIVKFATYGRGKHGIDFR